MLMSNCLKLILTKYGKEKRIMSITALDLAWIILKTLRTKPDIHFDKRNPDVFPSVGLLTVFNILQV